MATLNINGKKVQVSDDFLKMSPDQQNATVDEIAKSLGPQAAAGPSPLIKAGQDMTYAGQWDKPQGGPMDFLSQGMSGLNEGIAGTLGAPVDLATDAMNLGSAGANRFLGTSLPQIQHPFGGTDTFRTALSPTIKPESSDPAQQMTRRIGQEVGAFVIPGMGPVAKSAKPLAVAGKELAAALGSGAGAAIAQQAFPGNPLAEFAGQMVGGLTPGGLARMGGKGAKAVTDVTLDELRAAKNNAYKSVDESGVAYTPDAYVGMLSKIGQEANADHISPTRHQAAYSFIVDMAGRAGKPMSITELDQLRQEVRRDLITPSYGNPAKAADAHFGQSILDNIDELIATAKPSDLLAGNPKDAANALLKARSLNTRLRKSETLSDAVYKARLQTSSTGSGGNLNNAIRQQLRSILTNPKKIAAFSKEERAALENVVRQGKGEDLLRWLGKFSPGGNGLIGALEVVGTLHNPALAAMPVAGMVAKGMADRGTMKKVGALQQMVANGRTPPPLPRAPFLPPDARAAILAGQGVNQVPEPLRITVRGGR